AFGPVLTGSTARHTFTVRNVGTQNVTLSNPINLSSGLTLLSGFGATTLAPGASTTFAVGLNTSTPGNYSGQISFGTNDASNNPFQFTVTAQVGSSGMSDDGGAGFSTTGSGWLTWPTGYNGSVHYAHAG